MTHVTCRLATKNRDQLRNPTLGNRVWATFTFLVGFGLSSPFRFYRVLIGADRLQVDSKSFSETVPGINSLIATHWPMVTRHVPVSTKNVK